MANAQHMQEDFESEEDSALCVLSVSGDEQGHWLTSLLEGNPVRMQADTGAAVSCMSVATYKEIPPHLKPQPSDILLKTYPGETGPVKGEIEVTVELNTPTVYH